MKLLFDQNLSYKLVRRLESLFPESNHVAKLGLDEAADSEIWTYARNNDFILVTQDTDFYEMGLIKEVHPKIIWLRTGNTSTNNIQQVIEKNFLNIQDFVNDPEMVCLELF